MATVHYHAFTKMFCIWGEPPHFSIKHVCPVPKSEITLYKFIGHVKCFEENALISVICYLTSQTISNIVWHQILVKSISFLSCLLFIKLYNYSHIYLKKV